MYYCVSKYTQAHRYEQNQDAWKRISFNTELIHSYFVSRATVEFFAALAQMNTAESDLGSALHVMDRSETLLWHVLWPFGLHFWLSS